MNNTLKIFSLAIIASLLTHVYMFSGILVRIGIMHYQEGLLKS